MGAWNIRCPATIIALICACGSPEPLPAAAASPRRTIEDYATIAPTAMNDLGLEEIRGRVRERPCNLLYWTQLIVASSTQTQLDDPTGRTPTTDGYHYVGAIVRARGTTTTVVCTATALSRSIILTAAHCLFDRAHRRIETLEDAFYFVPATNAYLATLEYRLVTPIGPDSYRESDAQDLGLATLSKPLDDMAFPELASAAQAVGADVRKIGFGLWTDSSVPGVPVRRIGRRSTAIMRVSGFQFSGLQFDYTPIAPPLGMVCNGDSGGPSLIAGSNGRLAIAGVTHGSRDPQAGCHQGGTDTTVPGTGAAWIKTWMAGAPNR